MEEKSIERGLIQLLHLYINYGFLRKVLYHTVFNQGDLMPSPQELLNNNHGLQEEWLVGESYGEFLLQGLSLSQCLLHFAMIVKESSFLGMWAFQNIERQMPDLFFHHYLR